MHTFSGTPARTRLRSPEAPAVIEQCLPGPTSLHAVRPGIREIFQWGLPLWRNTNLQSSRSAARAVAGIIDHRPRNARGHFVRDPHSQGRALVRVST